MSENVGASTSPNPKDLHGLYRDNFILPYQHNCAKKYIISRVLLPSIISHVIHVQSYPKYGSILKKKQVQHTSANNTPDDDSIKVEICSVLLKILM
jgi:hypothetical protein